MLVYRRAADEPELLLLHRSHAGPAYEGDWAWGPPAGQREPGESVDQCAERELFEETGLRLVLTPCDAGSAVWPLYLAEAPADARVALSHEHDRCEWLPPARAVERSSPAVVREQVARAVELLLRPGPAPSSRG